MSARCPHSQERICDECLVGFRQVYEQVTSKPKESVEDVARAAICSLGSYDRGLQDYYQGRLNQALLDSRLTNEHSRSKT